MVQVHANDKFPSTYVRIPLFDDNTLARHDTPTQGISSPPRKRDLSSREQIKKFVCSFETRPATVPSFKKNIPWDKHTPSPAVAPSLYVVCVPWTPLSFFHPSLTRSCCYGSPILAFLNLFINPYSTPTAEHEHSRYRPFCLWGEQQ